MSERSDPLLPAAALPRSEQDVIDWLRLARSRRVGPATFIRLLRTHGSAAEALAALPGVAASAGVKDYAACPPATARHEIDAGHRIGARLVCLGTEAYPPRLAEIADAPPCLWVRGQGARIMEGGVALVGARNASALGIRMAESLARGLAAAPLTVISGLARGIDAAAHTASLDGGTVAVLAGGVDVIYPREHADLAAKIQERGALVSEMPIGLVAQARHFPRRNRIISGLADAVVVVEGATRSGSLLTARSALDQGREVLAVPGHPFDARAAGCNMLIRDGATLVRSAADVIDVLAPTSAAPSEVEASPRPSDAGAQPTATAVDADEHARRSTQSALLTLLGPSPVSEDLLIRQSGLRSAEVLEALTDLDLDGRIARHPGGYVSLAVA
ncbi:MAG: DNA-processing protein DprA [Pseudomonadota bacterium]